MARFGQVLQRVDRGLEVREPERSRILLELAADLDDLYRAYRERGCSDEEARRRAEAWLAPDPGVLAVLRRQHTPLADRLLSPLSDVARSRLESAALTVLALASVAAGLGMLRTMPFGWPPGPAALVVLLLGGLGAAVAGRRALDVFVSPDRGFRVPAWMPGLLTLAAGSAAAGALGACLQLYAALGPAAPATPTEAYLWRAVGTASGTAALGIVVALALAVAWFWLVARARVARGARADLREVTAITDDQQGG